MRWGPSWNTIVCCQDSYCTHQLPRYGHNSEITDSHRLGSGVCDERSEAPPSSDRAWFWWEPCGSNAELWLYQKLKETLSMWRCIQQGAVAPIVNDRQYTTTCNHVLTAVYNFFSPLQENHIGFLSILFGLTWTFQEIIIFGLKSTFRLNLGINNFYSSRFNNSQYKTYR